MQPLYDLTSYPVTDPGRGKTLLLMGLSKDGPVNMPIPISSSQAAKKMFGEEGSLYKAYERALEIDNSLTIYLMRIAGEHATCELWGSAEEFGEPVPLLKLNAVSGGEAYNDTDVVFEANEEGQLLMTIRFPAHTDLGPLQYVLDDYDNINMLVKEINQNTRDGYSIVHATSKYLEVDPRELASWNDSEPFTGGLDGVDITKNDIFMALEYSYGLLEGYYLDYVLPVDARFDDTHPAAFYGNAIYGTNIYEADRDYLSLKDSQNGDQLVTFYGQLIEFCKKQVGFGCMTHGVIGLNLVKDPTDLEKHEYSYIIKLLETSGFKNRYGLSEWSGGEWIDSGYYISVVAGEQIYHQGTEEEYFENMAVTYGAMLASLPPDKTTTNQKIPTDNPLRYEFSSAELNELSYMGVVAPRNSVRQGLVITSGVTAGLYNNDMHSVANVRQVQLTLSFLNEAIDEYVGEPILPLITSGTLNNAVSSVLESLKVDGLLIDYLYNIEYDESKGTGSLSVDLMAKNMIDYVSAKASFTFSG